MFSFISFSIFVFSFHLLPLNFCLMFEFFWFLCCFSCYLRVSVPCDAASESVEPNDEYLADKCLQILEHTLIYHFVYVCMYVRMYLSKPLCSAVCMRN